MFSRFGTDISNINLTVVSLQFCDIVGRKKVALLRRERATNLEPHNEEYYVFKGNKRAFEATYSSHYGTRGHQWVLEGKL